MIKNNIIQVELSEDEMKKAVVEYLSRKEIVCNPEDVRFEQKIVKDSSSCITGGTSHTYSCQARGIEISAPYLVSGTLNLSDLKV